MISSAGPRAKHIYPRAIYALGRAPRRMHAPLAQPPACACACACWCSPHALPHPPPAAALGDAPYANRGQTARRMHAQTRDFARRLGPGFEHARAVKVQACVQNSIGIMNDAAGDDWGELFVLRLGDAQDDVYTLEFCSRVDEDSDSESVSGLNTANTVASRLNVSIAPSDQHVLLVDMEEGNTVICLRCMHLATLLRACALLIAQQLVCLCSGNETVGLTGICSAPETKRIYQRIFQNFETVDFVRSVDMCTGTLRNESAEQVPQSLVAVADMLWTWYDKSAFMFDQPLALQIKGCKTRACECGASRELPHVATQPSVHAAGGQAHHCAAAALPGAPFIDRRKTADTLAGLLCEFGDNCKQASAAGSAWSWENIRACVQHAVLVFDDVAGAHWSPMVQLSTEEVEPIEANTLIYYLQFEGKAVLPDDAYQPFSLIPSDRCVLSRLKLVIKEADPAWFTPSEYTIPLPKWLVSMDQGSTVVCVRQMHLATLLRACALLVAQQIACLGTGPENISFEGVPASQATDRMYASLFPGLRGPTLRPLPTRHRDQVVPRAKWHAQLENVSHNLTPQSIVNVVNVIWTWYENKAWMYNSGPLPAQIRHASASAALVSVGPAAAACHRAPAQALTSEHPLYKYRGYRPIQLTLPWPVQSDNRA